MDVKLALRDALQRHSPFTHKAFGNLVMAFEFGAKNHGKKTWYGSDKTPKVYLKIGPCLRESIVAMLNDGLIKADTPDEDIFKKLRWFLLEFQVAYPNWPEAYDFADAFFNVEPELTGIVIKHVKENLTYR